MPCNGVATATAKANINVNLPAEFLVKGLQVYFEQQYLIERTNDGLVIPLGSVYATITVQDGGGGIEVKVSGWEPSVEKAQRKIQREVEECTTRLKGFYMKKRIAQLIKAQYEVNGEHLASNGALVINVEL